MRILAAVVIILAAFALGLAVHPALFALLILLVLLAV